MNDGIKSILIGGMFLSFIITSTTGLMMTSITDNLIMKYFGDPENHTKYPIKGVYGLSSSVVAIIDLNDSDNSTTIKEKKIEEWNQLHREINEQNRMSSDD